MKRSTRLEEIANINLGFENMAGASLSSATQQFEIQENQLTQLKLYKEEYQNQLSERLENRVTAPEIRDYQYFFDSLDQAIAQQTEKVRQCADVVESSRAIWLEKKQEVKKVSKAAANFKSIEFNKEQKREQAESDELQMQRAHLQSPLHRH